MNEAHKTSLSRNDEFHMLGPNTTASSHRFTQMDTDKKRMILICVYPCVSVAASFLAWVKCMGSSSGAGFVLTFFPCLRCAIRYASIFVTTLPCTSVSRNCRPWNLKVSFV